MACSLEGEGGRPPGMAADVSDMTAEDSSCICVLPVLSCAFCMSTLRLPVLGSMFVEWYCRSSDGSGGIVGVGVVKVEVEVEVKVGWVSIEESIWGYRCWSCNGGGGGGCWWGGDMMAGSVQGLNWIGLEIRVD